MPKFSDSEVLTQLEAIPGWSFEQNQISKAYSFDEYTKGLLFASACGLLAERRDHHPDLLITWRKVQVSLSTHSEGGVTEKDISLAKEIEDLI